MHGVQAIAETAAFLSTAMVIYLSFNAITHPYTLRLQLTHLWPWPSEGTVRVIGLGICLVAVATSRYLRATAAAPASPAAAEPRAGTGTALGSPGHATASRPARDARRRGFADTPTARPTRPGKMHAPQHTPHV